MSDPAYCRLLLHEPSAGAWNMAVDEMLLERAQHGGTACLRFYGWSEPTLSLGYFQQYEHRGQHAASLDCAAVRRLTGGGAILHDAELTYSLVLPAQHPLTAHRDELYRAVHGCLIEVLRHLEIPAQLCIGANRGNAKADEKHDAAPAPFLCFQRRALGDVLVGETKIAGSAQRRRGGAVLQHGSLVWRTSPAAPELPGLENVAFRPISVQTLRDMWLDRLGRQLAFPWQPDSLCEKEVSEAEALVKSRYGWENWTVNRGRTMHRGQESL